MGHRHALTAAVVIVMVLAAACASSDDSPPSGFATSTTGTDASETPTAADDASEAATDATPLPDGADDASEVATEATPLPDGVGVEVTCQRGASLAALPFDRSQAVLLGDAPDETTWLRWEFTITNTTESGYAVDNVVEVRYLDDDGTELAVVPFDNYPPAMTVLPNETVKRSTTFFEGISTAIPGATPEQAEELYARTASCEVGEELAAIAVEPFSPATGMTYDVTSCGLDETGTRVVAMITATNEGTEDRLISLHVGLYDAGNTRLQTTGTEPTTVAADQSVELVATAAAFTVTELQRLDSCEVIGSLQP